MPYCCGFVDLFARNAAFPLQCVGAGKLASGPNAGACTSFPVRYEKLSGQEADVGIVNAGEDARRPE